MSMTTAENAGDGSAKQTVEKNKVVPTQLGPTLSDYQAARPRAKTNPDSEPRRSGHQSHEHLPAHNRWFSEKWRAFFALVILLYHATVVLRVSLWFRPPTWSPHETKSALYAVCFNRTCTTQAKGVSAGLANMHVYGALVRKPTTTAGVLHNVVVDSIDVGKADDVDLWYWFLRHQTALDSPRYVASKVTNVGFPVCLTKACNNPVRYKIGAITYVVNETTPGSFASIGACNVRDRVCNHVYRVNPLAVSQHATEVAVIAAATGAENIYPMLMKEVGLPTSNEVLTFHELRRHFNCTHATADGGQHIYHGLDAGSVLAPPQYKPWKAALMDTTYATGTCKSLDNPNQFRFATNQNILPTDAPFTWTISQVQYTGVALPWKRGGLLPGYESIVDAQKRIQYIAKCDSLREFFLASELSVNLTDVYNGVPASISASRSFGYSFKNMTMGNLLSPKEKPKFQGGLQIVAEDPLATQGDNTYSQQSILHIFWKNSQTGNITSSLPLSEVPPSTRSGLTYLEVDILTGIYSMPALEVLARKLLNSTLKAVQGQACGNYSTSMHDYRGEVNKTQTYLTVCNAIFDAYETWKQLNDGAPAQPVRSDLPEVYPINIFNNNPRFDTSDLELISAVFTSIERGNLIMLTQGLVNLRIGFRGFERAANATAGTMVVEDRPRLFFVNSKFPIKTFCDKVDHSFFYSGAVRRAGKVLAVTAAAVITVMALPALYVFCFKSTLAERSVFRIIDIQDMIMTIAASVMSVRVALLVFSCCSAFVSRAWPEESWDPWYANTSLGLDLNWISWLLTASSSGAYLYGMSCLAQDCGINWLSPARGLIAPSLVNLLIPLGRFLIDWSQISNVSEYDDDWAAMPSAFSTGGMELVFAGIVFVLVMAFTSCHKVESIRELSVLRLEPYVIASVCYIKSRTKENQNRVPGWLMSLGGYSIIQNNGKVFLVRERFVAELRDGHVVGEAKPARRIGFYGRPVCRSID